MIKDLAANLLGLADMTNNLLQYQKSRLIQFGNMWDNSIRYKNNIDLKNVRMLVSSSAASGPKLQPPSDILYISFNGC